MTKRKRRRRLKKSVKFGIALILLMIVSIIYLFTHSNKYLFFKGLSKSYDEIIDIVDSFKLKYMPYFGVSYYSKIDSSIDVITSQIDSNIKLTGDVYISNSSNYYDLNIDANKAIYNLDLLSKEDKLYFKVDDSKYYYTSYDNANTSMNDYHKVLDNIVRKLKNNIKNKDVKKEKVSVSVDGKNFNTTKLTVCLDNEMYNDVFNSFDSDIEAKDMYLSIYLYKSNFIKLDLYSGVYAISFVSHNDYYELSFTNNNSISWIKIKDNKIDLLLDGIGKGLGEYDNKSFKIDFTDLNNNSIGLFSYSINKSSNKYINKIILKLNLSNLDIDFSSANEITPSKSVPNIDIKDSNIIDNITNQDKQTISKLLDVINIIFAF